MKCSQKFLVLTIIFVSGVLAGPLPVLANDLTITCQKDGCNLSPQFQPIFTSQNALPGEEYRSRLTVANQKEKAMKFFLAPANVISTENQASLAEVLIFKMINSDNGENLFEPIKLSDFVSQSGSILVDQIAGQTSKNYQLILSFNSEADNQYQGKTLQFNLAFGFEEDGLESDDVVLFLPKFKLVNKTENQASSTLSGQVAGAETEWLQPGGLQPKKNWPVITLIGAILLAALGLLLGRYLFKKFHTVD